MTNGAAHPGPTRRLPVFGTIAVAYRFAFRQAGPLARAAAVPIVVTLIADLRLLWAAHEQSMMTSARLFWFLLPFVATIPFATQCHRYFLETTSGNRPRFGFPWSRRETSFMLNALGLLGVMFLVNAIALPFVDRLVPGGSGTSADNPLGIVMVALVFVLTIYVVSRFSLVLPAAAIGRPLNWAMAWRRAADHGASLGMITVLAPLPWLVPAVLHMIAGPDATEIGSFLVTTAIIEACGLISTAIVMIALAAAYRWIMDGTGAVAPAGDA
jgi:hypothetical protein